MTASSRTGTLDLSPNALTVLERRYLVKDDQGKPAERPEDLFWRVARTIAEPDRRYGASDKALEGLAETFFELMATRVWMPNSPTLMNAGRPLGQLSACFVLPVDDALSNERSGIYDTLRAMALVPQSGGGRGGRGTTRATHARAPPWASSTPARCSGRWCTAPGRPGSRACTSSIGRTPTTRCRSSAATRRRTRAASSPCFPMMCATSGR